MHRKRMEWHVTLTKSNSDKRNWAFEKMAFICLVQQLNQKTPFKFLTFI